MTQETIGLGLLALASFCFLTPDPSLVIAGTAIPLLLYLADALPLPRLLSVAFPVLLCSITLNSLSTTLPLLSNKLQVILVQTIFSSATSLAIIATVLFPRRLGLSGASDRPWVSALSFGALWSTTWVIWEQVSPMGRLGVPSPHLASASCLLPVLRTFGHPGVDFLVGVSASTTYEFVRRSYSRLETLLPERFRRLGTPDTLLIETDERTPLIGRSGIASNGLSGKGGVRWLLASVIGFYAFLAILPQGPLLSLADGLEQTTPLSLSCALPPTDKGGSVQLDTLVHMSETLASQSKLVIWPENALLTTTIKGREQAIETIHSDVAKRYGVWVAMGIDSRGKSGTVQASRRKNEVVLVGPDGEVGDYEKQQLVPLVESYSMDHGEAEIPVWTIGLPPPPHVSKSAWSPSSPHTRQVAVLPLICLDSSHPTLLPAPTENGILMIQALSPALPLSSHLLSAARDLSAMHRMPSVLCSASSDRNPGSGISAVIDAGGRVLYVQRGGESFTVKLPLAHGPRGRTGWQFLGNKGVLGLEWGLWVAVILLHKIGHDWSAEQYHRFRRYLPSTSVARRLGWSQDARAVDLL